MHAIQEFPIFFPLAKFKIYDLESEKIRKILSYHLENTRKYVRIGNQAHNLGQEY